MKLSPLSVMVVTYNEEQNIAECLASVSGWAQQIFVVDSFSTDSTVTIARTFTEHVYQHPWENWASQKNWALANLPIATPWVLFLDADESVPPDFKSEVDLALERVPADVQAFLVSFDFYFFDRLLHHAVNHPSVPRLYRIGAATWIVEGARDYISLSGRYLALHSRIIHRDNKPIGAWIDKQNRNSSLEAEWQFKSMQMKSSSSEGVEADIKLAGSHRFRLWIRRHIYRRLPFLVRPVISFPYRYLLKLGFLDGWQGFVYTLLHGMWYPLLVDLKLEEIKQKVGKGQQ